MKAVCVSFRYNKTGKASKTYGGETWYEGKVKTSVEKVNSLNILNLEIETFQGAFPIYDKFVTFGVYENTQQLNVSMTEEFALELAQAILARLEKKEPKDFTFSNAE